MTNFLKMLKEHRALLSPWERFYFDRVVLALLCCFALIAASWLYLTITG